MSIGAALDARAAARAEIAGAALPLHFGDPASEYRAARQAAALRHRARRALIRATGADHRKLLHGLLTANVESLTSGAGRRALFLDTKGHVRGVLDLWAEDDATIIGCDIGFVDESLPDLTKYVLAADARFEDLRATHSVLAVVGPEAERLLSDAGLEPPSNTPGSHVSGAVAGVELRAARGSDLVVPHIELHVPVEAADEVWKALEGAWGDTPPSLGWGAAEALRIESGVPRLGAEITGEEFPQEVRLDDTVDYEKGCYLGQETVARIHYRGRVNRLLSGLIAETPLPPGAELISSGKGVGRVTSAADSPRMGAVALALVRREESEGGTVVQIRRDGNDIAEARVVALPIGD